MADKLSFNDNREQEDEFTDSEEEFSEEEKELLKEARRGRERDEGDSKKQLMAFADSDDEEDDDDDDNEQENMAESDIEGASDDDDLPDSRNWGKKASNYYNTDFVDPDFDSYTAEQEELAKLEEEEALAIQKRLTSQMREEDFMPDFFKDLMLQRSKEKAAEETNSSIQIKSDFAGLSLSDKRQLLQKDAPEFAGLMADFKLHSEELKSIITPVLDYVEKQQLPLIPALQFAQTYQNIALTYCSNIAFYLLLKAKRISLRAHPLTKRLVQLKQLLNQLQDKFENIIKPQLEALLERIVDGDAIEFVMPAVVSKPSKKHSKLDIMAQYSKKTVAADESKADAEQQSESGSSSDDDDDDAAEEDEQEMAEDDEDTRRGITYQIAKNKGLTPHRKKELRNPRVKHRGKFRKALIRRKGAVRTVRTETKRYGGEISGIKAGVTKSIKFKS